MFRFSLEPALNYRKTIEENLEKELGRLKKVLLIEKNEMQNLKNNKDILYNQLHLKQKENITPSELIIYSNFIGNISVRIRAQKDNITGITEKMSIKRDELIKAIKKRKTLDKLKEKALGIYRQEVLLEEQNVQNEIAIYRYNSNF